MWWAGGSNIAASVRSSIVAIGVDEIQYAKGHKYLTLVYQIEPECTRLLWLGKERTVESFEQFFIMIGQLLAEKIAFVCSDMWKPYLRVIRERCSQAVHILDRFHIVAKMNDVRAAEARRMAQDGHEPILKKTRWCVLKRKSNLTSHQRFCLRDLLRYNIKTVRAYLLKEDFQQFWDYVSPTWAGKFLDDWCRQAIRSRIPPMKKIAKTLRRHRELLLNYFRPKSQISSGAVEGLNNKAKLTMRKSCGFRTYRILQIALYHALGKIPEPPDIHRFFDQPISSLTSSALRRAPARRRLVGHVRVVDLRMARGPRLQDMHKSLSTRAEIDERIGANRHRYRH
jgi:transposase